ncbi:NYN domain-containing protein [Brassicibacter mesophilus]|uniref:NYN domain-containing protein n=1 Tax=Brassicibacter mesophilus TaxID=745119 RepID=UPI003D1CF0CD
MKGNVKEYLFVDGYNIINCWDDLRALSNISLETARNELIDIMAEYQSYTGIKVIIVFDAHLVRGSIEKKEIIKGIEIIYTKEKETADHYIERKLDEIGRIKKVRVATSDWIEQQIVIGRGGTRISARELKLEIGQQKNMIRRKNAKNNETNDLLIGRLDRKTLEKLEKWRKNE